MTTIANAITTRKPLPRAWYGWLGEEHGTWLLVDNTLNFLDDATQVWQTVELADFRLWGLLNGEVSLSEAQALADGDRVYKCSQTQQTRRAA